MASEAGASSRHGALWNVVEFVAGLISGDVTDNDPGAYCIPSDLIRSAKELVSERDRIMEERYGGLPHLSRTDRNWLVGSPFSIRQIAAARIASALDEHALPTLDDEFFEGTLSLSSPPADSDIYWLIGREMCSLALEAHLLFNEGEMKETDDETG